jgi:branched-chain amino acid transport system ATP-binding protein
MTPALEIRDLSVGYRRNLDVLHGVSLDVGQGDAVSLLGANGAGKTTLLRAISGLLQPRRGEIRFVGRNTVGLRPHAIARSGLAHVPEGRRILVRQTVGENLAVGSMGSREREERQAALLDVFPVLREKLHQPAGELSGGQQQMLAIARGLMSSPAMLMLDEPSLGLSPKLIDEVAVLLRRLREELSLTVLLVEQNAAMAAQVTERAYVMRRGEIVLEAPARELLGNEELRSAYLS